LSNEPVQPASTADVHRKEADFHDNWAAETPLEKISVREAFEAPTAPENRCILKMMGDLHGKRVLDVGAGLGESSVYFALQGAKVTATDLSPQMVETAVRLGKFHNVEIEGQVTAGESLDVPAGTYDFVYVANTIHHVTNKRSLFEQIHKALKPGGKFFSWDPLAYNPVINVYRRMATGVRTEDEAPLTFADVELARQYFSNVGHREFQIATLSIFLKYYLIDRVHPNQDRYWKRILRETNGSLWWWQPFRAADAVLTRLPLVKRLAWNMVMWGTRV
jgi:2-polyprenyl-3-methyl-5-hydroxy-6-metoxy-1,4-benzoquinol methylase